MSLGFLARLARAHAVLGAENMRREDVAQRNTQEEKGEKVHEGNQHEM